MIDDLDELGSDRFTQKYCGYEGYESTSEGSIDFLFEFIKYKDKKQFMGKMKELYLKQLETGSLGEKQDEDYLYEQYLTQEKLNEEYWEYISKTDNDPGYTPTPEEEEQNFQQRIKDENI
jgi:hypothetical protein